MVKFSAENKIKRMLINEIGGSEPARSHDSVHASSITRSEFCPRRHVLMKLYDRVSPAELVSHAMKITYAAGVDLQNRFNNEWMRNRMFGHWKCRRCWHLRKYSMYPEGWCPSCYWENTYEYEEVRLTHEATGVTGSFDAFVLMHSGKLRLVEVKIIAPEQFRELKAPLAEHRVRTNVYLQLLADSKEIQSLHEDIDVDKASVMYFMRSFGYKQEDGVISPIKEFEIDRDEASAKSFLSKGEAVKRSVDSNMTCGICSDLFDKKAVNCMVIKECFSHLHPANMTWVVGSENVPFDESMKIVLTGGASGNTDK